MGAGKEMWILEYDRTCEQFQDGHITEVDFRQFLKDRYYTQKEIDDEVDMFGFEE